MPNFEHHPTGKAILAKRHAAAGNFKDPQFQGQRFSDWDAGLLAAFHAAEAVQQARCDSFTRTFAPEHLTDADTGYENMREWSLEEVSRLDEIRGGSGDVLGYSELLDSFCFQPASDAAPPMFVSNPRPGNPLAGARIVAKLADLVWENPL